MERKWRYWKVSGKVEYFVTDIMAPDKGRALEICRGDFAEDIGIAADKGNAKLLELKAEPFRLATKEEVIDGYGEKAWEEGKEA